MINVAFFIIKSYDEAAIRTYFVIDIFHTISNKIPKQSLILILKTPLVTTLLRAYVHVSLIAL